MENVNPDLFEPYVRLVKIKIEDQEFQVPENNNILRAFQYMCLNLVHAKLCWNQECENCLFAFTDGKNEEIKRALACEQKTFDGMVITQMPEGMRLKW